MCSQAACNVDADCCSGSCNGGMCCGATGEVYGGQFAGDNVSWCCSGKTTTSTSNVCQ
jgi:hypothetical protein